MHSIQTGSQAQFVKSQGSPVCINAAIQEHATLPDGCAFQKGDCNLCHTALQECTRMDLGT